MSPRIQPGALGHYFALTFKDMSQIIDNYAKKTEHLKDTNEIQKKHYIYGLSQFDSLKI